MSDQSQVVVFNYVNWAIRYPELSGSVNGPLAQLYFNEAQLYCDNSPTSIVPNCAPAYQRTIFLNMLTAHIAALNASLNGQPPNPLVGRIANATEGSVNVTAQLDMQPGTPQWYAQTKYGIAYWTASSSFRTMRYVPGPQMNSNPWGTSNILPR